MNQTNKPSSIKKRHLRLLGTIVVLVGAGLALRIGNRVYERSRRPDHGPLYKVSEGPLTISVLTSGTIQSRQMATVRSAAEGRNTVLWIIDEGVSVTNGQLLIDLDASAFEDRVTDEQILVGNAEAALVATSEKLEISKIEQKSSILAAQLKLQLARLEQEKYLEGEYPQTLQEQESKIALAQEEVERAVENLRWTERLAKEGYLTFNELQADEMALKQKKISFQTATTALNVLTNFSDRQKIATLASNVQQAEMDLERVTRQTRANVVQAESDLRAKELQLERQRARLENFEQQVRNCRIVAPTNGIVIYHSTMQASRRRWGGEPLQAGSTVVMRQELIHIPVDGGMIVELSIPESNLTKLQIGQRAKIKVEALPDVEYAGRLRKIGLLPDGRNAWLNPDMQLYNCEIALKSHENLRAGMNCEVEMVIEKYDNVTYVPIQCIIRSGGKTVAYVEENGESQQREVKVGYDNGRMIHIVSGLKKGEKVLLNPPLEDGDVQHTADMEEAPIAPEPSTAETTSDSPESNDNRRRRRGSRTQRDTPTKGTGTETKRESVD